MGQTVDTPLSRALAQRVVDRISPTLRHNVNVMNPAGHIIASRDTARIGTLHAGARKAAATDTAVLIHRDEEHESGLAGANMPFEIDGRVAGVVGLTGDPATVSPLAEVAALAIKLLLEREREMDAAAKARGARPRAAGLVGQRRRHGTSPRRCARAARIPEHRRSPCSAVATCRTVAAALRGLGPRRFPHRLHRCPAVAAPAAAGASDDVTDLFARSGRYRWAPFRGATIRGRR